MIPDEMNDYERGYEDRRNENEEYISSLESQLSAKEQEIERLKEDNFKSLVFISDQGLILGDLRKRCEDLEAALRESINYWFFGYKSDYPEEREAFTEKCRNLLNQIKS